MLHVQSVKVKAFLFCGVTKRQSINMREKLWFPALLFLGFNTIVNRLKPSSFGGTRHSSNEAR